MSRWLQCVVVALTLCLCGCPSTPTPTQHHAAMKWDDVGAPEYSIYRGTSPSALTFLAVTAFATFTDTGVSGGQTYYYGVRSREPDGVESDLSNIIVATIPST